MENNNTSTDTHHTNGNEASSANPSGDDVGSGLDLASRGNRFLAALIDGIIIMVIALPVGYLLGIVGGHPSAGKSFLMSIIGLITFVLINGKSLRSAGQTIGKKVMNIKIVTESGQLPDVQEHLLKRYGVYWALGLVPWIGGLLALVNVLLIFGEKRQCGHDIVAKTLVVNA